MKKDKPPGEKDIVGPGYLKDLEDSFKKNALRKKTPDPVFGKAKIVNTFDRHAENRKYVPGVGFYKETDRAYKNHVIIAKPRVSTITNYAFTRFTEKASKDKNWVPGPGSYEIVPQLKRK